MKYLLSFLFIGMFPFLVYGIDNLRSPDVRSLGMGGNVVTQSTLFNPALIVYKEKRTVQLEYSNKYTLKELGTISGSFYYPNPVLSTGVDISVFGYDAYREVMLRVLVGKRLSEKWALGVGFHYSFLQSELSEKARGRLSTDVGVTVSPMDNLLIGVLILNLPTVSIGNKELDIEDFDYYLLQIGFQWAVINNLLMVGSVGTDNAHAWIGNMGLEYTAFDAFFLRAGIQTSLLLPSFGVGYHFSCFRVDAAATYHSTLGVSTGVGISFYF